MFRVLIGLAGAAVVISLLAGAVLAAVVSGGILAYLISLLVYPVRKCMSCGGSKGHGGKNVRRCWTCGGKGQYPRLGTRLLRPDVVKGIAAGKHARNW